MLKDRDISLLRKLAEKYMSIAALPAQEKTRALWRSLNGGRMQKPMVLIDQMPWEELQDESLLLQIEDPYWRRVERKLRQTLYKWEHLPVDMVLPPYIVLPRVITNVGYDGLGIQYSEKTLGSGAVRSHEYYDALEDEAAVAALHLPVIEWDPALEKKHVAEADRIFAGVAPFRIGGVIMHLGIWDWIAKARGVTNVYMDLYDRPEHLHAIMRKLTDGVLNAIRQYNALSAFDNAGITCHCSCTLSDDLPSGGDPVTSDKAWGFGLAQLFSSTSPEVTEEFELPYMKEIFSHFGAIYYGCCEKLDDRLELIDRLPNVRKVSCSPWSDRESFAEKLNKKYIMSNKPNPALLAAPDFDEALIRDDLRRTMRAARENGVQLEMILKDISTVKNDPARLWRWAQIAAEETANF